VNRLLLDARLLDAHGAMRVVPVVDHDDLTDLVADYEVAQGHEPSGGYGGIVPAWFRYGPLVSYYLVVRLQNGVGGRLAQL
jgi:hypothetical protein